MTSQPARYAPDAMPTLLDRYAAIRALTETLAAPLGPEDQCVQSMDDASPTKWHLGHTAWFFEALILVPFDAGYGPSIGATPICSTPITMRWGRVSLARNGA